MTQAEAEERLKQYGENKLKQKREFKAGKIFLSQFSSPLIYILVLAAAVTFILGDTIDAWVISAAVMLNTVLGFFQEMKAERGIETLGKMLTPKAKVIRDGERQIIEASQVVPGDICVLEIGERVAADGKIIESENLSLNEAMLTGESLPVHKKAESEVFMGTTVVSGIAKMLVAKTGQATTVGKIAGRINQTKETATPLQKNLAVFAKKLAFGIGGICLGIFILGLVKGDSFLEIFTTAVAVAVSAIPENLMIALTVILSLGMQRIFKQKALVRKLLAAETLGSVTVICCDKTGTLTEGKMRVVKTLTKDDPLLKKAAVWCNDLRDPLEIAMNEWSGIQPKSVRLDSIPFDPKTKLIATLHPGIIFVSGAPEVVLSKCSQPPLVDFKTEAVKGHRLVGFAYKKTSSLKIENSKIENLQWLGAIVFKDPVREGVKAALVAARQAGIKVKMITGDYRETAEAVGKSLGIEPEDIYSRVTPEQKLEIVTRLQVQGEVVAMTGDGVNDAPALKKADIGIVVAGAQAVAQETADMVLLDSNFTTILSAVEEGRSIFINLSRVVFFLMANAFAEVVLVVMCLICNLPLAVTAAQILWINLVNDSFPSFALTLEPKPQGLLQPPDGKKRELFGRRDRWFTGLTSGLTGLLAFSTFWLYLRAGKGLLLARSVTFTLVAVAPLFYVFSIKAGRRLKNLWLIGAAIFGLCLQAAVLYWPSLQTVFQTAPLRPADWLTVLGVGGMIIMIIEIIKAVKTL